MDLFCINGSTEGYTSRFIKVKEERAFICFVICLIEQLSMNERKQIERAARKHEGSHADEVSDDCRSIACEGSIPGGRRDRRKEGKKH